jgi:hypothetical protein
VFAFDFDLLFVLLNDRVDSFDAPMTIDKRFLVEVCIVLRTNRLSLFLWLFINLRVILPCRLLPANETV